MQLININFKHNLYNTNQDINLKSNDETIQIIFDKKHSEFLQKKHIFDNTNIPTINNGIDIDEINKFKQNIIQKQIKILKNTI